MKLTGFLKLEEAIADTQLFGTVKQVMLAKDVSENLATNKNADLNNLIIVLRDDLRRELNLKKITDKKMVYLRMSR